jgi:hypothetical protein
MKIGFYCESPADQAAMAVFAEGILGEPPEPISTPLEGQSMPRFLHALDGVFRGIYFNSDAEGLIIVCDADNTGLHDPDREAPAGCGQHCRYCRCHKIIAAVRQQLKPRPRGQELKVAIGLAVPTIEAWYLVGKNHQVGEAQWAVGLQQGGQIPFTSPQLKTMVYKTARPPIELETERAVAEARRIIQDVSAIETAFPKGFGLMAQEIRRWINQ